MSEADKFKRNFQQKNELVTKFPVALKQSKSSDGQVSWMSVMAEENPETKEIELENFTTLHAQQKMQWTNILYKIIALEDNTIWRVMVLILIVVNFIQVSYSYFFLRDSKNYFTYYTIIACDAIYCIDFILACMIYFWRSLQLRVVNPPRSKLTLIWDSVLVIPYSFIYEIIYKDTMSVKFILLRSISFLRLFHLPRFFKHKSNSAGTNHWKYFITQYFTYFFLMQHTLACIWYLLACPVKCTRYGGWSVPLQAKNRFPETRFQWYLVCMYFSLVNITTCGFGDITPTNSLERVIGGLAMTLGFTLTTGVFIGTLTSQFVNTTLRRALMRNQISSINRHLKDIRMDKKRIKHIMGYYHILWTKKKGIQFADDIQLLPLPLRMEICFDVNICLLQCSLIFRDKPEPFLRTVSLLMIHEFLQPGEIIYHQHVIKYKMVCVASGVVEILSDEDNQSPIISFAAGTCIGEAALIIALPARATMRAACYTEIQVLYKKDFYGIIDCYPEIFSEIRMSILERIDNAMQEETDFEENREAVSLSLYISHQRQASAIKKLKDRLNPNITVDPKEQFHTKCLSLYKLSENIRKKKGTHLCMTSTFPWILQPDTSLTWTWEVLIVINTMMIGILYPFYIAFERGFPPWLDVASVFMESLNLIDVYVILTTAIIEKDQSITKFSQILNRRMNTFGFYLDVFSVFCLEVLAHLISDSDHLYYILKLNRLLKMYRICKFFQHLEKSLTLNLVTIRLIKYPIYLMIGPFWFGGILYLETCYNADCTENGWFQNKLKEYLRRKSTTSCTGHVIHMSVYYALTCMSGLGYGDIEPGNMQDLVIVSFGVLVGIFIFGYCTAEFSATFTHNLKKKTDFQEALYALQKFMHDNRMNKEIKDRVSNFFILQWYYNDGVNVVGKQELFYNATVKIQQEVVVKERMETLINIPLFFGTELDFLQLIATGSRIIILPPNEIVCYAGGLSREMYIIQEGYCTLQLDNNEERVIGPNAHFGIGSLLYGLASLSTIRTITHVKLINIEAGVFTRAISMFPIIGKELQQAQEQLQTDERMAYIKQIVVDSTFPGRKHSHKTKFYQSLVNFFKKFSLKGSFVNVHGYCKKHGEDYNKPFKKLGNFFWLKYLLLPICILPDGAFIKFWVTLRFVTSITISLLTPYQQIQVPYIPILDRFVFSLDVIAYLDLYIMMLVGYYGEQHELITHPYKTAGHYLKGLFIFDLILCCPWEVIVKLLRSDHNEGHSAFGHQLSPHIFHCSFRLIRIFQVYRLPKAFQYLENDITKKGDILQIFKFVPFTIIFINLWACLVIITSCKYYHESDLKGFIMSDGNAKPNRMAERIYYEYTVFCAEDSWIDKSIFRKYSLPLNIYLVAIYYCTSTLVGSGFGDLTAQDQTHLSITMAMIIFGVLFFGYIYASISSHKAGLHSTLSHFQEMLKELKTFMEYESVDKELQQKLIDHYEYKWKRTGGTEPNVILGNLHTALLEDAVLYMYEATLREVPLFEHVERSFFRIIGRELRERYYQRGQTIVRANDIIQYIYIIYRGKVEVISSYNEMQAFMGVGGLFGNITPQSKAKCTVTITALRNLDTLFIKSETFYTILKRYPSIKRKIDTILKEAQDYIMPTTINDDEDSDIKLDLPQKDDEVDESASSRGQNTTKSSASTVGASTVGASTVGASTIGTQGPIGAVKTIFFPNRWFRVAISPDATIFTIYSYLTMMAAYVNCFVVTYHFAFQHHTLVMFMLTVILDIIFIVKMFIEIHKAYVDRYGEYVTDNKKIRQMYFRQKKLRLMDCLANIPITYIAFILPTFTKQNPYLYFSCFRLITLLRFYYIVEFYRIRTSKLLANTLYLKISTIIMWITLIVHIFACIWYLFACPVTFCYPKSWITHIREFASNSKFEQYILCIYFILNVLTTTGTGDITPTRKIELAYVVIIMIATKFFIGMFIGDVTSVLNAYTASLVSYEYGIAELKDYLQNMNVSEHQMEKMWHYVRQLWTRNRGKQIPRLVNMLPYVMRCDLMTEIYGQHIRLSYVFAGTEEPFIRQLTAVLNHVVFFPGNYIVQHGDSDQCMYIIHRGEVDILTVHPNLTETIHDVLIAGEMFGLAQGLYHGVPHHFSFRARTTVDIICLRLSEWQHLLKFFPYSRELIYHRAETVYIRL